MTKLSDIRGIGPALARALSDRGVATPQDLAAARPEALCALPKIGPRRAEALIAAARAALTASGAAPDPAPDPTAAAAVPASPVVTALVKSRGGRSKTPSKPGKDRRVVPMRTAAPHPAEPAEDPAARAETEAEIWARKKAKAKAKAEKAKRKAELLTAEFEKAKKKAKAKAKKAKLKAKEAKQKAKAKAAKKKKQA